MDYPATWPGESLSVTNKNPDAALCHLAIPVRLASATLLNFVSQAN